MSKVQSSEHLVADLPAEFLHQRRIDQRAAARVAVRLHLNVADDELILVQIEIAVGVDGKREHEILRLLIVGAEPADPGDFGHARHRADFLRVGKWQRQRDRILIGRDQLVRSGRAAARMRKGVVHRLQHAEQEKGDNHGQQGEDGAGLFAPQRGPDERKVFHGRS
jgi:hypothetical protein